MPHESTRQADTRALAVMIHASSVNRDPNGVIRLATDLRFANADAPYDERWCRG